MQCCDNFCPNCISGMVRVCCVYLSKTFGKKQKSYDGLNQLQEEEFRFKQKDKSERKKIFSNEDEQAQPISKISKKQIQASLNDAIEVSNVNVEMEVKLLLGQQKKQLPGQMNILEQQKTNQVAEPSQYGQFSLNIDIYNPYYQILQEKTSNLKNLLERKGNNIDVGISESGLKVQQLGGEVGSTIKMQYKLPCSYSFYTNMVNNQGKTINKLSNLIEEVSLLESSQPNLKVLYISLKKFMALEGRDFVYLKYTYGTDNRHWQICTTHHSLQQKKQGQRKKAAEFYSVTHFQQLNEKGSSYLIIKTFLNADFKLNIKNPKLLTKCLAQVKDYIQQMYRYCDKGFQQQLA